MDGLLSAEEEKVHSKLVDEHGSEIKSMNLLGTYRDEAFDFTCKFVAKAYCEMHRTTSSSKDKIAVGLKDRDSVGLLLQLAQCLTTLYGTSMTMEIYTSFLSDILPINLTRRWLVDKDRIIEDVEDVRQLIEDDTADQLIAIINDIFKGGPDYFEGVRKKASSSFVGYNPPPPEESQAVVDDDAQTHKLKGSIDKLLEQAGIDCTDEKKLFGDDLYYNNIDNLYSFVDIIFQQPIEEVETIAGILQHYPEFKPLEDEMMNYVHAGIGNDCLIDGLGDASSTFSGTQVQNFLPGENSPSSKFKWILLILKETVTQLRMHASSWVYQSGLTHPEYVEIVTAPEDTKIDQFSCRFTSKLVPGFEPCKFSKCQHVLRKSMLSMVEHHRSIKSKFVTFRQELTKNGKMAHLDPESYDILLYVVSYIRHEAIVLKNANMRLSRRIDSCRKIYEGSNVHQQLALFYKKQDELCGRLTQSLTACELYMNSLEEFSDPEPTKAFGILIGELKQFVRVIEDASVTS